MNSKPLVVLESPFAPRDQYTVDDNITYARRALRDSLLRGEAPIASHLLHTQTGVLDDTIEEQRAMGIEAGLAWLPFALCSAVYVDHGVSRGMILGMERALSHGVLLHFRSVYGLDEEAIQARVPKAIVEAAMKGAEESAGAVLSMAKEETTKRAESIARAVGRFTETTVLHIDGHSISMDEAVAVVAAMLRLGDHYSKTLGIPRAYVNQLMQSLMEGS